MTGYHLGLLFAAAGLLVLAGVTLGRARGRPPSASARLLMAGMTGMALGFLLLVMPVLPFALFPLAVACILAADWGRRGAWALLGALLLGGGGFWLLTELQSFVNDVSDAAVSRPGWTPVPLGLSVAAVILGSALLIATRGETRAQET